MEAELDALINYHAEINSLKQTKRYNAIKEVTADTSASHSWQLALLTLDVIERLNLDLDPIKVIRLALVHDLGEYQMEHDFDYIDIQNGTRTQKEKETAEAHAMQRIKEQFKRPDIFDLWHEYEEHETNEARCIKALDKIETLLHVLTTADHQKTMNVGYANKAVAAYPQLQPLLTAIKERFKRIYHEHGHEWKEEYDKV